LPLRTRSPTISRWCPSEKTRTPCTSTPTKCAIFSSEWFKRISSTKSSARWFSTSWTKSTAHRRKASKPCPTSWKIPTLQSSRGESSKSQLSNRRTWASSTSTCWRPDSPTSRCTRPRTQSSSSGRNRIHLAARRSWRRSSARGALKWTWPSKRQQPRPIEWRIHWIWVRPWRLVQWLARHWNRSQDWSCPRLQTTFTWSSIHLARNSSKDRVQNDN